MCITGPCGGTKKCFKIKAEKKTYKKKIKKVETYLPVN